MITLAIIDAEYVDQYRLKLSFPDSTIQVVDFGPFLINHPHPQHNKYKNLTNFRRFHIERGNVVWGKDWDLLFPVSQLHQGYLAPAIY